MKLPLAVLGSIGLASFTSAFRLATWNLRFDALPDNITVAESIASLPDPLTPIAYLSKSGEQPWSLRRLLVAERVLSEGTALFSVQEALVRQIKDLEELLGSDWGYVRYVWCAKESAKLTARTGWCWSLGRQDSRRIQCYLLPEECVHVAVHRQLLAIVRKLLSCRPRFRLMRRQKHTV